MKITQKLALTQKMGNVDPVPIMHIFVSNIGMPILVLVFARYFIFGKKFPVGDKAKIMVFLKVWLVAVVSIYGIYPIVLFFDWSTLNQETNGKFLFPLILSTVYARRLLIPIDSN